MLRYISLHIVLGKVMVVVICGGGVCGVLKKTIDILVHLEGSILVGFL